MTNTPDPTLPSATMVPPLTVIVVVFNAAKFLEQTILSILAQDNEGIDIIVIDGGSMDGTRDIINKYKENIFYWVSEPDKGIYDAFNKGWNAARPDSHIMFLGGGDRIVSLPDQKTLEGADVVYGKVLMDEGIEFRSKVDFRSKLGNTLHHQALFVKKSLCPESPFDLRFKIYADFDFNQRLVKKNAKFTFSENFISYAQPGGVSQQLRFREAASVVKKNFGWPYALLAWIYYLYKSVQRRFQRIA
jgi:glycosyltransferase involved in cell wall biosynthesis